MEKQRERPRQRLSIRDTDRAKDRDRDRHDQDQDEKRPPHSQSDRLRRSKSDRGIQRQDSKRRDRSDRDPRKKEDSGRRHSKDAKDNDNDKDTERPRRSNSERRLSSRRSKVGRSKSDSDQRRNLQRHDSKRTNDRSNGEDDTTALPNSSRQEDDANRLKGMDVTEESTLTISTTSDPRHIETETTTTTPFKQPVGRSISLQDQPVPRRRIPGITTLFKDNHNINTHTRTTGPPPPLDESSRRSTHGRGTGGGGGLFKVLRTISRDSAKNSHLTTTNLQIHQPRTPSRMERTLSLKNFSRAVKLGSGTTTSTPSRETTNTVDPREAVLDLDLLDNNDPEQDDQRLHLATRMARNSDDDDISVDVMSLDADTSDRGDHMSGSSYTTQTAAVATTNTNSSPQLEQPTRSMYSSSFPNIHTMTDSEEDLLGMAARVETKRQLPLHRSNSFQRVGLARSNSFGLGPSKSSHDSSTTLTRKGLNRSDSFKRVGVGQSQSPRPAVQNDDSGTNHLNEQSVNWMDASILSGSSSKLRHMDLDRMEAQGEVLSASQHGYLSDDTSRGGRDQQSTSLLGPTENSGSGSGSDFHMSWGKTAQEQFHDEVIPSMEAYANEIPDMDPATTPRRPLMASSNKRENLKRVNSLLFSNHKDWNHVDQSNNLMDWRDASVKEFRRPARSFANAPGGFSKRASSLVSWCCPRDPRRRQFVLLLVLFVTGVTCVVYFVVPEIASKHWKGPNQDTSNSGTNAFPTDALVTDPPGSGKNSSTNAPAPPMDSHSGSTTDEFQSVLVDEFKVAPANHLRNSSHPAFHAVLWLATTDPAQLDAHDARVPERFALATLYYSTHPKLAPFHSQGKPIPDEALVKNEQWSREDNWMTEASVCEWYGVECQDTVVTHLNLTHNHVWGELPFEFKALSHLTVLDLSKNERLAGNLTEDLVSHWPRLEYLILHENNLQGNLPKELGNLTNMEALSLWRNGFEGIIVTALNQLTKLQTLLLQDNRLTGSIPNLSALSDLGT